MKKSDSEDLASFVRQVARASAMQAAPAVAEGPTVLAEYGSLLRRYRLKLAAFAAAGLLTALVVSVFTRPLYRTRTSVDLQSINGDFMKLNEVSRVGAESSDTAQQTQIKLLESDTLTARTEAALLRERHPQSLPKKDGISRVLEALHIRSGVTLPYTAVLAATANRLKVKPLGATRLIEVNCESWDPQVAQSFCNRLVREYKDQDVETRSEEAQGTSKFLSQQLADIKQKTLESQRQLEVAVGNNGLMLSQETNSTGEERLRDLQTELVRAQADRMQKESDASVARTATADALPNVMDNPAYRQYQTRLAELRSKLSALAPSLTDDNPKIIQLRAQIDDAENGLLAARSASSGRQNNEVASARHREQLLQVTYDAQLAKVSTDLQKASQVSLLRREVESEQQLYQSLLQRAREAGFATAMQASTMRIVDFAPLPNAPIAPRPMFGAVAGLALGGLAGAGFFLLRDRSRPLLRMPGQAPQMLELRELGVIPRMHTGSQANLLAKATSWRSGRTLADGSNAQTDALSMTGWDDRFSIMAEAYRSTSFAIAMDGVGSKARIYVMTSPSDGEGKTTLTTNIGVALSRSRLRVLLIDGDMRRPRLHRAFGLRADHGLRDILKGDVDVRNMPLSEFVQTTSTPNLSILAGQSGTEDTVALLHSASLNVLLERLSAEYDVILIDTPPMLHMADARILGGHSHGSILIFRAGETTFDQARQARDLLDRDGIPVVGSVLNAFEPEAEGISDYYSSYTRYHAQEPEREASPV